MPTLDILYEDNHLLVVNKPAGIATMGAESGDTIHSLAADYLKQTYNKPGKAYVGIVSRLDAMTSGVLVLARTSKAAARLSAQFAGRSDNPVKKIYLAVVEGQLERDRDQWVDWVRKDDAAHRMRLVLADTPPSQAGAQEARMRYVSVGQGEESSVVAVELLSGRKHQIRVQFSGHGHPVIGDRKYGSARPFALGVALHSWQLQIIHPTKRQPMWFRADPPHTWKAFRRLMPGNREIQQRIATFLELPTSDDGA